MCGIFCSLSAQAHVPPSQEVLGRLKCRGPDSENTICVRAGPSSCNVTLCSTVLSLRGSDVTRQPYRDSEGRYALCWNGEAWSINNETGIEDDTATVHKLLCEAVCTGQSVDRLDRAEQIASALSSVAGPYAFVFLDRDCGHLYFGRDFLGRRSLCWRRNTDGDLLISSITDGDSAPAWREIEPDGIYFIDVNDLYMTRTGTSQQDISDSSLPAAATLVPYSFIDEGSSVIPRLSLNKAIPPNPSPLNESASAVNQLHVLLRESLSLRVLNVPDPPALIGKPKVGILFSGGLDCTVLARICHDLLPREESIDLLNVAFESPRIHARLEGGANAAYELCPDRITGRASCVELQTVCSGRTWRFVAINIPYSETLAHREKVTSLMHPHNTEMDLSISYALYFAARGVGQITDAESGTASRHTTPARVLLSGLGADELFGGYTRHATAFRRAGFPGLLDELELDVSRLGKRNLGRDDRVISHWGKEARFPFLDERLLAWTLNAPVTDKCGFGELLDDAASDRSPGIELAKKVLRCLAWKLGMKNAAKEKKRAVLLQLFHVDTMSSC